MSRTSSLLLLLAAVTVPALAQNPAPTSDVRGAESTVNDYIPKLLPRALELELALSALPEHLRSEASVLVLERGGLVEGKSGSNGFLCMVRRAGAVPGPYVRSIVPICYDREGATTLVPAVEDEIRLLEEGVAAEEVRDRIEAGWEAGRYRAPAFGVAYMLSAAFSVGRPNGERVTYIPHIMVYAPYGNNVSIGADGDRYGFVPFMQVEGKPSSMMVLPVGTAEREQISREQAGLRRRAAEFLGR